nr:serrate RNA effector molecule-like isoform X1 [Physcomitrium patens]XP_024389260.1 serrate RNA effector molecule-like isoform X1 [Physcomitrium patens]|eukprot:XP_024389259.1 serrate RNA effector molecule-like isoform X1 [Physcomitrella patens]
MTDAIVKAREELYFQNYMRDVDAVGSDQTTFTHLQQNSGGKSREHRRPSIFGPSIDDVVDQKNSDKQRPSTEVHQSRDTKFIPRTDEVFEECSKVRDDEQFERDGLEKSQFYREKSEHSSPPRVFLPLRTARPSLFGGRHLGSCFERVSMEPLMFDHFSDSPFHGLPGDLIVPDIPCPPQVLMPVPGAGCSPLGPFVPAPPGITMRFLIEGPGPSHCDFERSFVDDNNRWPRDRNRPTPGPRLGGGLSDFPSMMIPPHGSHYDPRGIQSYHDLDTPRDEVTVIDYRTL